MSSPPAQIPQVLAQMDRLDPNSRLSISWDPLPCHLQNGGDVGYIIQYSLAGDSEVRSISTYTTEPYYSNTVESDNRLSCTQEPVGPYRCYFTSSLLLEDQMYTFQVAAMNGYGVGPFSDLVNATLHSQTGNCTAQNNYLVIF